MAGSDTLTSTMEDYLEAIYVLGGAHKGVRVGDIAKQVNVHKSTATAALRVLAARCLIEYAPYKPVRLAPQGRRLGARIHHRHENLFRFLTGVLNVDRKRAEETACKMEHVIPYDIIERFTAFTDFHGNCPHSEAYYASESGFVCSEAFSDKGCAYCGTLGPERCPHRRHSGGSAREGPLETSL